MLQIRSRQPLRLGLAIKKKQSIVSAHALFCDGDYALPKLLSLSVGVHDHSHNTTSLCCLYTALHCLPSFRQMNTSGLVQASDSDNDDLTKLVATLQSLVDSESEQARSTLKQYTTQQLSLSLESVGHVSSVGHCPVCSSVCLPSSLLCIHLQVSVT